MKPDRSNYEIWFIDWLDGNLDEEQVEDLKLFLLHNPDLGEELDGISIISLESTDSIFAGKHDLKKSPGSLSEFQFEHLCIASMENDLSDAQKAELNEIIDQSESKRRIYELFQLLRLKPSNVIFKRKSIVKKITAGQKILRWSFIGLSTAAGIAVLIFTYLLIPGDLNKEMEQIAQINRPDTLLIEISTPIFNNEKKIYSDRSKTTPAINYSIDGTAAKQNITIAQHAKTEIPDSVTDFRRSESIGIVKVAMTEDIIASYRSSANVLIASNPGYIPPLIDDRSNVERLLARFFHEKIMKDTNAGSRPVESFEIAQAGITGLNKLLGWEMTLQKNANENGEVKSYYFSSRLLKFNAPVKKSVNNL